MTLLIARSSKLQRLLTKIYDITDRTIKNLQPFFNLPYPNNKEIVVYVTSGSVRIHSAQDNESPILTLGVGTLLGESCLLYSSKSPVRVTASGFCVVQVLHKRDFWREASKYAKLKQVERIHQKFKVKMEDAKMLQMERVVTRHDGWVVKYKYTNFS